jgi:hypothetical protein
MTTRGTTTGRGAITMGGTHTGAGATMGGAQTGGTGAHTTRGGGGNPMEMLKLNSARAGVAIASPKARAPIPMMVLVFITEGSTSPPSADSNSPH